MDALTVLRESRVFRNLSPAAMAQLSMIAEERELGARVTLFNEGDEGNTLFLIRYGTVSILRKDRQSGAEEEIATLGTGCLLYTSPSPRDRTRSRMPSSA